MRKISLILGYILLAGGAVSMIVPFLWMVSVSFMQDSQIFSIPPAIFPNPLIFDNYTNVFSNINITKFFLNSLFVALLTTVFQVIFSAFAGYAFARARFRGRDLLFFLFLLTMMIPPQVNIIPLFFLMRELGWVDTYQALILPGIFGGFGVFLMRQWFMSFSKEIEDAAKIDGWLLGFWRVFQNCAAACGACDRNAWDFYFYHRVERFYVAVDSDEFA